MILKYVVDKDSDNKTVKYILKNKLEISERLVKKLKFNSKVLLNSIPVYVNAIVKSGDIVEAFIDFIEENDEIIPQNIDIDILYEDDSVIVINKQPNIVVHPTFNHPDGTIANGVMYHFKKNNILKIIRPVSRLDKDTSGIIIFAKNQHVQDLLIKQMGDKTFHKEYIGVVNGIVENKKGTINLPIDRAPDSIMLRHISDTGSPSVTHYEVKKYLNNATYLKFALETGRTHQIRVHCKAIEHSLIGDTLYSDLVTDLIARQALHSYKVQYIHPITKELMEHIAPIPNDILSLLEILGK